MTSACSMCKYSFIGGFGKAMYCRRFPPHTVSTEIVKWPPVLPTEWCGEFDVREDLQQLDRTTRTHIAKKQWGKFIGVDLEKKS